MLRTCLTSVLLLALAGPAAALDPRTAKVIEKLDCDGYRMTDIRQRADMVDPVPVWALVNTGPSRIGIFLGNTREMIADYAAHAPGEMSAFIGDANYRYTVGLAEAGSATVYICKTK